MVMRFGLSTAIALFLLATPGQSQGAVEQDPNDPVSNKVRRAALVSYVHGMTAEIAHREVGLEGVPHLLDLLRDPEFPRRDNIVAMIAYLGSGDATDRLLEFVAAPPASHEVPEEDRALFLVGEALGRIAGRGDDDALHALLEMASPGSHGGPLNDATRRGAYSERTRDDLIEGVVRGLGFAGSPLARARLLELVEDRTPPVVEGLELSRAASHALEIYDSIAPRAPHPAGAAPERATETPESTTDPDSRFDGDMAPGPIGIDMPDTNTTLHDSPLSYAVHVGQTAYMSDIRLDDILHRGTVIAGAPDSEFDVACCVTFSRSGNWQTFGTIGDGLWAIDNEDELTAVVDDPVARVKVVRFINWCGSPGTNILGCSRVPDDSMVLVDMSNPESEAQLWIHEYGHNVGLFHSPHSNRIMYQYLAPEARGLVQDECDSYHSPPSATHMVPVNLGSCDDDDADGVPNHGDRCPDDYDPDQDNSDNDEFGDVCDNCPDESNASQADDDEDGHGDPCDNCPQDHNPDQSNPDNDLYGDPCDPCPVDFENDQDNDGYCEVDDNCPDEWNPDQENSDGDAAGDFCDPCAHDALDDQDNDGRCADVDNCPEISNADQADRDLDGIGDICDACPDGELDPDNDGLTCSFDDCPLDANNDIDGDSICGEIDTCPGVFNPEQTSGTYLAPLDDRRWYSLSPNGGWVVIRQDLDTEDDYELYSMPIQGGAPIKLNGPLAPSRDVHSDFVISADSSRVVYVADQEDVDFPELFSAPIGGGTPVKLNGPLQASGGLMFTVSPDGSTVVYRAYQDSADTLELYSVPIGGGVATKISGPMAAGGGVENDFAISPDGSRVVYLAAQDSIVDELYSVPIDGGATVKLNAPLAGYIDASDPFVISPDSSRVVYFGEQDSAGVDELYSVAIDGGTPVKLNGPLAAPPDTRIHSDYAISPDSAWVVYRADQDVNRVDEIFSVPIAGGTATRLNPPLIYPFFVGVFEISPDSTAVLYRGEVESVDNWELYVVPIEGGGSTKLNGPLVAGGGVVGQAVRPGGAEVLFWADDKVDYHTELYTVPITGGVITQLSHGGRLDSWYEPRYSSDGSRVAYVAAEDVEGLNELYSVPAEGGPRQKLNGVLPATFEVTSFAISSNDIRVVYVAQRYIVPPALELYTTMLTPDSDFDGWIYSCDCAPQDSTRWAAPTEAIDLRLQHDAAQNVTTLTWREPLDPGAATVWYDVVRSPDPGAFGTEGVCVESGDGDTVATDSTLPGSPGLYFLVRGENGCPIGVGSVGTDSDGVERDAAVCP